jgi:endonuclease-3
LSLFFALILPIRRISVIIEERGGYSAFLFIHFVLNFFMATLTKNQKIEALVKLVQRRCRGAGLSHPPQRTVLETLMYAALLENTTFDKADAAYTVLENYYIDWNEIRVCSNRELADTLTDLPNPDAAAERVRKALQGIFEKTYEFNLEEYRKKGKALAEHLKALESMSATPYMIQYTAQVALDGHLIPFDEASLRIMRRLNLAQVSSDGTQEICIGLDRVILKKSGLTFAAQLHHFAAGYYDVPDSPELLTFLSAIDRDAVNRSWTSPVLTPPPPPAPLPVQTSADKTKPTTPPPPEKPKVPPKVVAKPAPPSKPVVKPVQPSVKPPVKSPAKPPVKKPGKPVTPVKKPLPKPSKASPSKKVPPKKPVKPVTPPPKKKAMAKKKGTFKPTKPVKPVKKPKAVSPSKSLRKRKPK